MFIYVQHQIGLDLGSLNITPVFAIVAVLVVGGVIAGAVIMGDRMDKKGRARYAIPSVLFLVVGLIAVYFAKTLAVFGVCAIVFIAGYGLISILLSAAIRDFTPEDKAGSFQGIRMIFGVMIPMIIGPAIGSAVTEQFALKTYTNDYGEVVNVPPPHIFLAAAVVAIMIIIPLVFLIKEWKRIESEKASAESK